MGELPRHIEQYCGRAHCCLAVPEQLWDIESEYPTNNVPAWANLAGLNNGEFNNRYHCDQNLSVHLQVISGNVFYVR